MLILNYLLMKKIFLILSFMCFIPITLFGTTPQSRQNPNDYVKFAREALNKKDYDGVMMWADKYYKVNKTYEPFKDISEQMYKDVKVIYPDDKKAFVKPLEYAAKMGNAKALHTLGIQHVAGRYLPKDEAKGMALIKAAEKLGDPEAAETYKKFKLTFDNVNAYNNKVLQERQRKYTEQILTAATAVAVVAAAAALIGNSFKGSSSKGGGYNYGNDGSNRKGGGNTNGSSRKNDKNDSGGGIDVENIGMPQYTWETDWYKDSLMPFSSNESLKNTAGENQARKIKFKGVGTGKIVHVAGYDGYWSSKKRYKTLNDAIIAEYVLLKYGKIREKGRMY